VAVRPPLAKGFRIEAYDLEEQCALGIAVVVGGDNALWLLRALWLVEQGRPCDSCLCADEIDDAVLLTAHAANHHHALRTIGEFK
jgi:hypothetical protein